MTVSYVRTQGYICYNAVDGYSKLQFVFPCSEPDLKFVLQKRPPLFASLFSVIDILKDVLEPSREINLNARFVLLP